MREGKGNIFLSLICPFDFFSSCLDVESHLQSHDSLILVAELFVRAPPFRTEQTEELEIDFFHISTLQLCARDNTASISPRDIRSYDRF